MQDDAEPAVRSDEVGGGPPDALPDELAQSAAGFVVCLGLGVAALIAYRVQHACHSVTVFSTVASFGMVDLDCDAPAAEKLGTSSRSRRLLTRSRSPTPYGLLALQTLASLW